MADRKGRKRYTLHVWGWTCGDDYDDEQSADYFSKESVYAFSEEEAENKILTRMSERWHVDVIHTEFK